MARVVGQLQPINEVWEWQMHGRCRDRTGAQFFHPDDDLGRISRRLREAAAKQVCAACPVRKQCATHALTVGEEYGVWGGYSETERAALRQLGWRDTLDRRRLTDVDRLDRRLARMAAQKQREREHRLREAERRACDAAERRSGPTPVSPPSRGEPGRGSRAAGRAVVRSRAS